MIRRIIACILFVCTCLSFFPVMASAITVSIPNPLPIDYLSQNKEEHWKVIADNGLKTMNCGPACCVMIDAYLKGSFIGDNNTDNDPDPDKILEVDNFLYGKGLGKPKQGYEYLGPPGGTSIGDLYKVFKYFMKYENTKTKSGMGIEDIKDLIDHGYPVIVPVDRIYWPDSKEVHYAGHFVIVKGYNDGGFLLNDPGRSSSNGLGKQAHYSFSEFYDDVWQDNHSLLYIESLPEEITLNSDVTLTNGIEKQGFFQSIGNFFKGIGNWFSKTFNNIFQPKAANAIAPTTDDYSVPQITPDGTYPVYITGVSNKDGIHYLSLMTLTEYDVLYEYLDKVCIPGEEYYDSAMGRNVWSETRWEMEKYYDNNYPVKENKDGIIRQINIQELPEILGITKSELLKELSEFCKENDNVIFYTIVNDEVQYRISEYCLIEVSGWPLLKQEEMRSANYLNPTILSTEELEKRIEQYFHNNKTEGYFGSTTIEIKDGIIVHFVETYSLGWG